MSITAEQLRNKYLEFFKEKGHVIIPSASLVPENDPSILFTTAGMHPLVPYLMGEKHPEGKRLVNVQKCIRTADIDDVGDNRHLTFFEMMGNWSLGSYFKKEAIEWSWEFLTDKKWLGLDHQRIYATTFAGENGIPRDEESLAVWQGIFEKENLTNGVAEDGVLKSDTRIIPLGVEDNFWIAGETGPCGADTEMFYDTRPEEGEMSGKFSELVASGRLLEIWNDVFMEFNKTDDGKYEPLAQKNVDTGMGVERTLAVLNKKENVFDTELFVPIFSELESISGKKYLSNEESFRVIADHVKTSTLMLADGVLPSNTDRGYVLRRLIRRAIRHGKIIDIEKNFVSDVAKVVIGMYKDTYKEVGDNKDIILSELEKEEEKFRITLGSGLKEFNKISGENINGKDAFNLYQTYGFPIEITKELAHEKGIKIDEKVFNEELKKHQDLSRTASVGKFKGGLADTSEETTSLHTAAHLLLAALRKVLGDHVTQKGSNITAERLRFDFSHPEKLTDKQKEEVENLVNDAIQKDMPVTYEEMTVEEAKDKGASGVFESKYGQTIKVYKAGNENETFSYEICGGPHVEHTGTLGKFKIKKEKSSSAGSKED